MQLVQLLLPLHDNDGRDFPPVYFNEVRAELTERFGGVTAFIRAPAVGLWKESAEDVNRDEVVMFEVLADELDKSWWSTYRQQLQKKFRQDEVLMWASSITRL
ncbi:MAG TPA: hypothetical protein VGP81_02975 [Pyrinomonadaceae bacterium]|jgi:hypothetical protein|nr:hypothetical protein [Pyrinomonadaceae bacterium]